MAQKVKALTAMLGGLNLVPGFTPWKASMDSYSCPHHEHCDTHVPAHDGFKKRKHMQPDK